MQIIKRFTDEEQNTLEEIMRVYKLDLIIFREEDDGWDGNDLFEDCETGEILSAKEGVSQIIDVINCDDRELFNSLDDLTIEIFNDLCQELNL